MTCLLLGGTIDGRPLDGVFEVPSSKSLTNRALVAAAAAGGGVIEAPLECEDTRLLATALAAAGWRVDWPDAARATLGPRQSDRGETTVFLGNSGTGARLILALLAGTEGRFVLDGTARLRERPMGPLLEALGSLGAEVTTTTGGLPIRIRGARLAGGSLAIAPAVSSQFVTALLLTAPAMSAGLRLEITGELPSAPYLDLTADVLRNFGATVDWSADRRFWRVAPGGLTPTRYRVEGDWSAAAFGFAAAAVAGGSVEVTPLDPHSAQGDRAVCRLLETCGVRFDTRGGRVRASGPATGPLRGDLRATPDLFPALAVVAAGHAGSRLTGLDHLRHKESDRLRVMVGHLRRLGAVIREDGSSLVVEHPIDREPHDPIEVDAAGDHRVAMAMAVAALRHGPLALDQPEAVDKSFPGFWSAWQRLLNEPGRGGSPG